MPALARQVADDLLARLDRAAPGRISGFYVVGSASIGAFRAGRSDVDFVAIVRGGFQRRDLARIRAVHLGRWTTALARDVALARRWPLVCNGIYLTSGDLSTPVLEVTPLAGSVAGRFRVRSRDGFDVNPVTWHMLAHHGITIRGPEPNRLGIHRDEAELRAWLLANLNGYWRHWAERAQRGSLPIAGLLPRRSAAWGVLGAPRLHYTLATGKIASKEVAAQHALTAFEPRWHPLIQDALAFWRGEKPDGPYRRHPTRQQHDAGAFVSSVIDAANHDGRAPAAR